MLTWEGAALVANLMTEYSIDFVAILWHEINDRAFGEITNLPFPYLIQRLCDEACVPKVPGVDERVLMTTIMKMKSMKDLAYSGLPRRSSERAAVP